MYRLIAIVLLFMTLGCTRSMLVSPPCPSMDDIDPVVVRACLVPTNPQDNLEELLAKGLWSRLEVKPYCIYGKSYDRAKKNYMTLWEYIQISTKLGCRIK